MRDIQLRVNMIWGEGVIVDIHHKCGHWMRGSVLGFCGILLIASTGWAAQVVEVTEYSSPQVFLSFDGLNTFIFPERVSRVIKSVPSMDTSTEGNYVFVSAGTIDGELMVIGASGALYTFRTLRQAGGGETIVIKDMRVPVFIPKEIPLVKNAPDYVHQVVTLLELGARGVLPSEYEAVPVDDEVLPEWVPMSGEGYVYRGPRFAVWVLTLLNDTDELATLRPQEFFGGQELGVAISSDRVLPQQHVRIVFVREVVHNGEDGEGS